MSNQDESPEQVVTRLRGLLNRVRETMVDVSLTAGDEMGGEFDEADALIRHGIDQAFKALEKW